MARTRRIAKRVGQLVAANGVTSALNIATLALVARGVGPVGLGTLALVEAYGRAVDQLVRLEPWQALIRYGVAAIEDGREGDLRQLIKFGILFDLLGATAAAVIAVAGVALVGPFFGFGPEATTVALLFSASLAFSVSSSMTAVLRMFDRFAFLGVTTMVVGVARLAMTAAAAHFAPSVLSFGLVLVATQVLTHLLVVAVGVRELRARGLGDAWRAPLGGVLGKNPRILRFIVNTNLNVIVKQMASRFDVLVVGALVSTADLGLYQLARRIGVTAQRVDGPLRQVIYPDCARLAATGDRRGLRRMVLGINGAIAVAGVAGLLVVAPMLDEIVVAAFGEAFAGAAPILFWQLLAVVVMMNGSTLSPALQALGADGPLLAVTVASTAAFYVALVPLTMLAGVTMATVAFLAFNTVWVAAALTILLRRTASARLPAVAGAGVRTGV